MSNKRKQTALDLDQKIAIINEIEAGKKQAAVAATRGLSKQTINSIWQKREKLRHAFESCASNRRKRLRTSAFDDVEEALLKWFSVVRAQNLSVSGPLLRGKAQEFAKQLQHDQFQCSVGWLDRFKARYNIVFRDASGDAAAVNSDVCDAKRLPDLLSANAPRQTDETGSFCRLLPHKTMSFKGDSCHGGKQSKEPITDIVCSEKLPL